ncbi:MAG TPA: Gp15 family bacteriophage protein [Clostridiales bacterium]|nr:Gp15 family bacteriophage protein [Clostridiales bacterium]
MINLATTPPPEYININGYAYAVDTDFKTWIEIIDLLDEFDTKAGITPENVKIMVDVQMLAFNAKINEPWQDVFTEMARFARGYPTDDNGFRSSESTERFVSFSYDLNWIVLAIRNQSGIDLSYRRKSPFHWWLFLLEFYSLAGDHYILDIIRRRQYKGNDSEHQRARDAVALPLKLTAEERRNIADIEAALNGKQQRKSQMPVLRGESGGAENTRRRMPRYMGEMQKSKM